ncbi:hypothetical protein [Novosphingobium sp. M1R2S20]|uniref:Uncharacterized protein n=1 Tax=Novosphingobium rhizovicinum TaxID=3228928 RepID=A0ABV3RE37_9SPHN
MNRHLSTRSPRFEFVAFCALTLVMLTTRSHALSDVVHLPDTSLASFFLLGFLVRRASAFAGLFLFGFAIDVWTIFVMGGSGFCFTPAYWMLLPAYGVMWFAGRVVADGFGEERSALAAGIALLIAATLVSKLLSSGGFYFLGGRYPDPTIAEFLPRLERYFPGTLFATLLWSGIGATVYAVYKAAQPRLSRAHAQ